MTTAKLGHRQLFNGVLPILGVVDNLPVVYRFIYPEQRNVQARNEYMYLRRSNIVTTRPGAGAGYWRVRGRFTHTKNIPGTATPSTGLP